MTIRGHRLAQTKMKKSATQPRKETLDLDLADPIAAGAVDNYGAVGADNGDDLAHLVWKYFGEEISETLKEVQAALAPEQSGSKHLNHRKG